MKLVESGRWDVAANTGPHGARYGNTCSRRAGVSFHVASPTANRRMYHISDIHASSLFHYSSVVLLVAFCYFRQCSQLHIGSIFLEKSR
jgi:hypothetical protein